MYRGDELLRRLQRLWTEPFESADEALAAFADTYADPVRINGVYVPLADVVARARSLQRSFAELEIEPIEVVEAPDRAVIAFWQRGRHVGPLETPLGEVASTGRRFAIRVIDVLSLTDGRISAIEVVPDTLGMLTQLGAVTLAQRPEAA